MQEFDLIRARTRWLHVGHDAGLPSPDSPQPNDDSQTDPAGRQSYKAHGTSMLSLVAGKNVGVAKNIDPIIVRLPRNSVEYFGGSRPEEWLQGLREIYDDLGRQRMISTSTTAVVLLAQYWPRASFYKKNRANDLIKGPDGNYIDESAGFEIDAARMLRRLISRGALVVTGSGNAPAIKIDGWPANFGKPSDANYASSLIVAGAISPDGKDTYYAVDRPGTLPHGELQPPGRRHSLD